MKQAKSKKFPGGSKSRVNLAGENIRSRTGSLNDYNVIDEWRAAHGAVLNTFQAILRTRTRGKGIFVAQRHKRKTTIFGKLDRFPEMQLARMDDVAGCRLIFSNIKDLYAFRGIFHRARFNHKRRNEIDKYDYIKKPKSTGYRGIHDVYVYDVNSELGRHLKGLMVEIQYRTKIQHAWATAVEVIGFITESQPKFQEGDNRYQKAMALASEILARAFESSNGPYPNKDRAELVRDFLNLDKELRLLKTLQGLNSADANISTNRNSILVISPSGDLEILTFRDAPEALRALFQLEKEHPEKDIVLVRADTSEEVRFAFKNYFSDAKDFVYLVEEGCQRLSGANMINKSVVIKALKKK
ncbi:MAG: RelA/SpoT domain-containing protein [Proteobacteria bacterium]|nr:RelA/SpoT domain-containing protein [Pseudomonadota bacterium]MBU4472182.1 RelA/SpoT domain-containing protein [Pseudomonadota bacterium]MCG2750391.1 RelA/SpoT domain-containing protein [Desulfobacteraceae bacterium]